jgi:hypothetical protein
MRGKVPPALPAFRAQDSRTGRLLRTERQEMPAPAVLRQVRPAVLVQQLRDGWLRVLE